MKHESSSRVDPTPLGNSIGAPRGRDRWRSLEESVAGPASEGVGGHAPVGIGAPPEDRRDVLKLMAGSLALGSLGACTRQPDERIFAYARRPEHTIPGRPRWFATSMVHDGGAMGLLVESHEGRPTKVEGNPDHPASLGATDVFAQASVLELYDPDRSRVVRRAGRISTFEAFESKLREKLAPLEARGGEGLRILSPTVTSPTLQRQRDELLAAMPNARWVERDAVGRSVEREAHRIAFGRALRVAPRLEGATRILCIDADILGEGPAHLRSAREFSRGRRVRGEGAPDPASMNRLYAVESTPSTTGSAADHRLALSPSQIQDFIRALATRCAPGAPPGALPGPELPESAQAFLDAVVADLMAFRGRCVVIGGPRLLVDSQVSLISVNRALGAYGSSLELIPDGAEEADEDFAGLVGEMRAGEVEALVVLGGNPVYDAPADLEFAAAMAAVEFRVHLGLHEDETSAHCHWHLPKAHFLESWSDGRAFEGTASIVQPLIAPLYGGHSEHELVARIAGEGPRDGHGLVRATWRGAWGQPEIDDADFEARWSRALHDGWIEGSAPEPWIPGESSMRVPGPTGPVERARGEFELDLRPDGRAWDGCFANNGWLQELPRTASLLVWDNAVLLSPRTARQRGWETGDRVEIERAEDAGWAATTVEAAVMVLPGQADETATLHLGYGRRAELGLGRGLGFDAYPLTRSGDRGWTVRVNLRAIGGTHGFATTQMHHSMEGRDLIRVDHAGHEARGGGHGHAVGAVGDGGHGSPGEDAEGGDSQGAQSQGHGHGESDGHGAHGDTSIYPRHAYDSYAWAMVIDLNACIGCNACTISCQSENNIPIVGKDEVAKGREMHWIRVDRYWEGDPDAPDNLVMLHQPVTCMHCENAPCEVVCPVGATVHGDEGLNEMVYNRCVGTRYCSNNCPYKVRRFNFYQYSDMTTESRKLGRNPDVTVRTRGVMEKCTYCVQRINGARITAEKEGRRIREGEIRTACQAVCPTEAIVFGDKNAAESEVAGLRSEPHHYGLLEELNTSPRTTYLSKWRNPNPDLHVG